jgi:hypothetical protein
MAEIMDCGEIRVCDLPAGECALGVMLGDCWERAVYWRIIGKASAIATPLLFGDPLRQGSSCSLKKFFSENKSVQGGRCTVKTSRMARNRTGRANC